MYNFRVSSVSKNEMNFRNIKFKSHVSYILLGVGFLYGFYRLINDVYLRFYENVLLAQNSKNEFINEKSMTLPYISNEYISNWGAFGDFIGGTLNPILTFLSVCLILYTVYQNKKSLDFNSEELALSRKAQQDSATSQELIQKTQNLQQFDSLFFSLLNQFKHQQDELFSLNENDESKVDKIYNSIFVINCDLELEDKRYQLLQNQELNQYFICLFQLFKLINTKINRSTNKTEKIQEWGDYALEKQYTNILRSLIPLKLQQLLFLNAYTEFDEYRWYLSYYNFLEHMPFKNLAHDDALCIDLIVASKFYKLDGGTLHGDFQVFGKSIYFEGLLSHSCYLDFLQSDELFFSSWELIEAKIFNFKKAICFFDKKNDFSLNTKLSYTYFVVNRYPDGLRFFDYKIDCSSLNAAIENSNGFVGLKDIVFTDKGFFFSFNSCFYEFYCFDDMSVLKYTEDMKRTNRGDFITIKKFDSSSIFVNLQ
ncbi:hypothetical protein PJ15_2470 [Acinetobacter sp. neg1]|nr:hypothetical protein PJ15_2470 [Acinetobacter sp. neg1]